MALARAVGLGGLRDTAATAVLPWAAAAGATAVGRTADHPVGRWLLRLGSAGLVEHATLRMAAVDAAVAEAVAGGCDQVVILGAGLDTRGWRLEALAGCTVLELDLPGIQESKRRRIGRRRPTAAHVDLVPADLVRDDLDRVLDAAGHDPSRATAWVWEGVAVYLPPHAVTATLAMVGRRSAPGSRLAMTFVRPRLTPGPRLLDDAARAAFATLGEPLRTLLDRAELEELVAAAGLRLVEVTSWRDWARSAGVTPGVNLLAAEQLALARRDGRPRESDG